MALITQIGPWFQFPIQKPGSDHTLQENNPFDTIPSLLPSWHRPNRAKRSWHSSNSYVSLSHDRQVVKKAQKHT